MLWQLNAIRDGSYTPEMDAGPAILGFIGDILGGASEIIGGSTSATPTGSRELDENERKLLDLFYELQPQLKQAVTNRITAEGDILNFLQQRLGPAREALTVLQSQMGVGKDLVQNAKNLIGATSRTVQAGDQATPFTQPALQQLFTGTQQAQDIFGGAQSGAENAFADLDRELGALREQGKDSSVSAPTQAFIRAAGEELQSPILSQGATAEERSLIDQIATGTISRGSADINNFLQDSLEQIRDVLAPSRGLRPQDTPIVDRGERVAREANRAFGNLIETTRTNAANQLLEFPLKRATQLGGVRQQALGTIGQGAGMAEATLQQSRGIQANAAQAAVNARLQEASTRLQGGAQLGGATAQGGATAIDALRSLFGVTSAPGATSNLILGGGGAPAVSAFNDIAQSIPTGLNIPVDQAGGLQALQALLSRGGGTKTTSNLGVDDVAELLPSIDKITKWLGI